MASRNESAENRKEGAEEPEKAEVRGSANLSGLWLEGTSISG